jgi:hypothetical protein
LRTNAKRLPEVLNLELNGKHPTGRLRSRQEEQTRKDDKQKERRPQEETEEEELQEDRDRWRGFVVRQPTS